MSIEVISDPAQVAAARDAYRQRTEHDLLQSLKHPGEIDLSPRGRALLEAHGSRVVDAMSALRDDPKQAPGRRFSAIRVLKALGVESAARLVAQLAAADQETLIGLLIHAPELYPPDGPLPPEVRRTIVEAWRRGGRLIGWAEDAAARYQLTEVADEWIARLQPGDTLRRIAKLRPTPELFALMDRWLRDAIAAPPPPPVSDDDEEPDFDEPDRSPRRVAALTLIGMLDLAEATSDPALRERAVQTYVAFHQAVPKQFAAQDFQTGLGIASKLRPPELAQRIQVEVARGARDQILRQCALTGVFAFDQKLARRIAAETKTPLDVGKVAKNPGPGDDEILAVLVRDGVITADEAERAKTAPDKPLEMGDDPSETEFTGYHVGPVGVVLSKLRRYLFLDANGDDVPNRNDLFIEKFVPPSMGRFKPEVVVETYSEPIDENGTGSYEVQFVHGGRLYRFHPWDHDTEMDLDAHVAAVNRALADAGAAERFVRIAPDAVFAHYAFAEPAAFRRAAEELGLTVAEGP